MGDRWVEVMDLQLRAWRALSRHKMLSYVALRQQWGFTDDEKDQVFRGCEYALKVATPVYVSENVTSLIEMCWSELRAQEFRISDPFIPNGFALLPRPLLIKSGELQWPIRAFAWSEGLHYDPRSIGHVVFTFATQDDMLSIADKGMSIDGKNAIDPERLTSAGFFEWGITGTALIPWGQVSDVHLARFFQAFWQLGNQFVRAEQRLPRSERRNAARYGIPREHVTVIRLRRARTSTDPQHSCVQPEWSCQWMVRGHWRNQWYPSERRHKQIFVAPYIKGPDDKPLKITEPVVEFVR